MWRRHAIKHNQQYCIQLASILCLWFVYKRLAVARQSNMVLAQRINWVKFYTSLHN